MKIQRFNYLLFFLLSSAVLAEPAQTHTSESDIAARLSSEIARENYVNGLTEIVWKYLHVDKGPVWDVLSPGFDALVGEIAKHPAPANSDAEVFRKLLIGDWQSPRHDYAFYADGTWRMLPLDECTTHGCWKIEGNQFWFDWGMNEKPDFIILLNKKFFVYGSTPHPYFMRRISK